MIDKKISHNSIGRLLSGEEIEDAILNKLENKQQNNSLTPKIPVFKEMPAQMGPKEILKKESWSNVEEFGNLINRELNAKWNEGSVDNLINNGMDKEDIKNDLEIHLYNKVLSFLDDERCFKSFRHWSNTVKKILQYRIIDLSKKYNNSKKTFLKKTINNEALAAFDQHDIRSEKDKYATPNVTLISLGEKQGEDENGVGFKNAGEMKVDKMTHDEYQDSLDNKSLYEILPISISKIQLDQDEKDCISRLLKTSNIEDGIKNNKKLLISIRRKLIKNK